MIKYLGSKRRLLDLIGDAVGRVAPGPTVLDLFSGTSRVGHALKRRGFRVVANDHNAYAHALARCYIEADLDDVDHEARLLIDEFNRLPGRPGYVTETFCERSRFFQPKNGARIDAIREAIAAKGLRPDLEAVLLVSLMEAADRVESTTGVQMAYLKQWAARAGNALDLQDLEFHEGPVGTHIVGDSLLNTYPESSVAYLDPPYSAHSYATYYHIWDSITRWDKPAVGLKTNRRMDRVSGSEGFDDAMTSQWNSKRTALDAFMRLVDRLPVRYVVISYNDESIVPLEQLTTALKGKYPQMAVKKIPYKRNIMCQIGNAEAEGAKTKNTEVLIWLQKC